MSKPIHPNSPQPLQVPILSLKYKGKGDIFTDIEGAALHRRPGREPTTLAYSSHRPSLPSRPRRVLITPDLVMSGMIEALH